MDTPQNLNDNNKGQAERTLMPSAKAGKIILLHKKTERLIAAIYLVSDLLPDSDPMKVKIRQAGTDLVTFIVSSQMFSRNIDEKFTTQYSLRVLEILSFLDIAQLAGLISEMNHSVLVQEINSMIGICDSIISEDGSVWGKLSGSDKIQKSESKIYQAILSPELSKGHPKRQKVGVSSDKASDTGAPTLVVDKKDSRRRIILDMLSGGKALTVRDFTSVISDCSEKTIQRELLALVSENVLKKEGERRWSRYSLLDKKPLLAVMS